MKHANEIENILCLKSKPLFLGQEKQGVFIEIKDFQTLLEYVGDNLEPRE